MGQLAAGGRASTLRAVLASAAAGMLLGCATVSEAPVARLQMVRFETLRGPLSPDPIAEPTAAVDAVAVAEAAPAPVETAKVEQVKAEPAEAPVSRLAEIARRQSNEPRPTLIRASYTAPPARPMASAPLMEPTAPSVAAAYGMGARPDVFGTVAMPISRTPADARWRRVSQVGPLGSGPWDELVDSLSQMSPRERLNAVNLYVNRRVSFAADLNTSGTADRWATAQETLGQGRGDCEDYAIAKMQLLRAAGVPASSLYLVLARDLVRRADHAVLAVRLDGRFYILDSGGDAVLPAEQVRDYRPVFTYSAGKSWMHGYKQQPNPKLMLASASR